LDFLISTMRCWSNKGYKKRLCYFTFVWSFLVVAEWRWRSDSFSVTHIQSLTSLTVFMKLMCAFQQIYSNHVMLYIWPLILIAWKCVYIKNVT